MTRKRGTTTLYIVKDDKNNTYLRKYQSKVAYLLGVQPNTVTKWFSKGVTEHKYKNFDVIKCTNVDLKGFYRNNFH